MRHPDWLRDHKVNLIVQMALEKHPDLPNVPLLSDLASNAETKQVLKVIAASQSLARPFVAPPGIPADRADALRKAFADTLKDPAFLADAKSLGVEVRYVSPEQIGTVLEDLYKVTPDQIAKAKAAVGGRM